MKTALSSFDLRALVAEWQELIGGHVDKAYQKADEVILRINAPARGKVELFYQAGQWLCLHDVENKPESPPPFAQSLRRLLDNARIQGIEKQTKVKELSDAQVDGLFTALNNLAVAVDQEPHPRVVFQIGRAIDATPIELAQYRDFESREFPTFNEALSHYVTVAEPQTAMAENVAAKFERRIAQQRESMEALREEAMRLEAQAVFLYGHYA